MDTRPNRTARSPFSSSVSRAQFSPVFRRSTRGGGLRPLTGSLRSDAPPTRWWDPHLLDRLQPPLTRYRD